MVLQTGKKKSRNKIYFINWFLGAVLLELSSLA